MKNWNVNFLLISCLRSSNSKVKLKCTLVQALGLRTMRTAYTRSSTLSLTTAVEGSERSASRPGRSLPPVNTRYPLNRRLGGSQSRSGQVQKISSPPGFDPRTAQPVANGHSDNAIRPTSSNSSSVVIIAFPHTNEHQLVGRDFRKGSNI